MESVRKEDAPSNIPHMHLFMYLKRRFPELKDADITDSIQRFGLDKIRCEDELSRKCHDQHRGYYSPWNRSRASSSRGSPFSPSEGLSHASSPLQNGSSPPTPFSGHPQFPLTSPPAFGGASHGGPDGGPPPLPHTLFAPPLGLTSPTLEGTALGAGKGGVYSGAPTHTTTSSPYYYRSRFSPSPSSPLLQGGVGHAPNGYPVSEPSSAPILPRGAEPVFGNVGISRRRSADALPERKRFWYPAGLDPEVLRVAEFPPEDQGSRGGDLDGPQRVGGSNPGSPIVTLSSAMSPTRNETSPVAAARTNLVSPHSGAHRGLSPPHQEQHQQLPAAIEEQRGRKERLKEELSRRMEEKTKLEEEVKNLALEIESREKMQRLQVLNSKKEIELIQQENSKLQFACDEMEREILESGEAPKTDQGGRGRSREISSSHPQEPPLRAAPPPPLARASSTSSLSSGGGVTTLVPSRKAPSPPASSPVTPPETTIGGQGTDGGSPRPATIGSDENGKKWSCSKCTFINSPFLNECEMCSFPHFSIVREI